VFTVWLAHSVFDVEGIGTKTPFESWKTGQRINDLLWTASETGLGDTDDLDLYPVLLYFKLVVLGVVELQPRGSNIGLGRRSWTIFSALLKERFPEDPDVDVFPWNDQVHPHFKSSDMADRVRYSSLLYDQFELA